MHWSGLMPIDTAEENISEFEDIAIEIIQNETKGIKKWTAYSKLWNNFKQPNINVIGVHKERRKVGEEKIFKEVIEEKFPSLMTVINPAIQEAQ